MIPNQSESRILSGLNNRMLTYDATISVLIILHAGQENTWSYFIYDIIEGTQEHF